MFDRLFLHKYTGEGSGCDTECVWGTCVDLLPGYLYVCSSWAEVESTKATKSRLRVYKRAFFATFDLLLLHKYACDGSDCETECVWGTCVDMGQGYLYVCSSLAEVESIKAAKSRLRVYKRAFLRLLTCYFFTNTHGKAVVVTQNVCGVPVWT